MVQYNVPGSSDFGQEGLDGFLKEGGTFGEVLREVPVRAGDGPGTESGKLLAESVEVIDFDFSGEEVDGLFAGGIGHFEDGKGTLALEGRIVEPPFAGQDEVGLLDMLLELEPIRDEIEPGDKAGIGGSDETEADATGGPCSGHREEVIGFLKVAEKHGREAFAFGFQKGKAVLGEAFLRPVNGGRTTGSEKRVGDVTGNADGREAIPAGMEKVSSEVIDFGPTGRGDAGDRSVVPIAELQAEGFEGTEAEVAGGAAPDSEEKGVGPLFDGEGHELAGAEGSGFEAVALLRPHAFHAGGLGHFDDGEIAFGGEIEPPPRGIGHPLEVGKPEKGGLLAKARAEDGQLVKAAADGLGHNFTKAFSAVGEGSAEGRPAGMMPVQGVGGHNAGGFGGHRVLEFIEGDENIHTCGTLKIDLSGGNAIRGFVSGEEVRFFSCGCTRDPTGYSAMSGKGILLLLLTAAVLLPVLLQGQLYLGMEEQAVYFEMKGYPTSTAEAGSRKFLIYPNGVRLTVENGRLVAVEGMAFLTEKPTDEPEAGVEPSEAEVPAPPPMEDRSEPDPVGEGGAGSIPSFPSESVDDPVPPELAISEEERARLQNLRQAAEGEPEEVEGREALFEDYESSGGVSPGGWVRVFLVELLVSIVIGLIVLKVAAHLVGVTVFFPGLFAIALVDSLVRLGLGNVFLAMGWPLGGPLQILVSFFVMLYLVKGFTSAREWPTIIQLVVMTKVVSVALWWLATLVLLNVLG